MGVNQVYGPKYGRVSNTDGNVSGQPSSTETSFETLLEGKVRENLNFSKHAARRLDERGIAMDRCLMGNLEHAVDEARKKGAKDVAVIGSQGIFIVNVPNNVVVTTMSQEDMKDRIMTNIDSAVFM